MLYRHGSHGVIYFMLAFLAALERLRIGLDGLIDELMSS
jgi:hypothetical protein